jgi:hypothetical protein
MPRITDCIADCVWFTVPQPTEWQHTGNQIDANVIATTPCRGLSLSRPDQNIDRENS